VCGVPRADLTFFQLEEWKAEQELAGVDSYLKDRDRSICLSDLRSTTGICETGEGEGGPATMQAHRWRDNVLALRTPFELALIGLLLTVAALCASRFVDG
jgi:hypothetical protein